MQVMDEARDSITSVFVTANEIIAGYFIWQFHFHYLFIHMHKRSVDGKIRNYDIRVGALRTDTIGRTSNRSFSCYYLLLLKILLQMSV